MRYYVSLSTLYSSPYDGGCEATHGHLDKRYAGSKTASNAKNIYRVAQKTGPMQKCSKYKYKYIKNCKALLYEIG